MPEKNSLSKQVAEKIESSPYIRSCLSDGIVNYSALARLYKSELESTGNGNFNEETIMVAIKRYAENMKSWQEDINHSEILAGMSLGLHEDMVFGVFEKTERVLGQFENTLMEKNWEVGEVRIIIEDPLTITAMLKKSKFDRLRENVEEKLVMDYRDFSMITIKWPYVVNKIYGLVSIISTEMARNGISILIHCTPTDVYVLVEEEKAEAAYKALKGLVKKFGQRWRGAKG